MSDLLNNPIPLKGPWLFGWALDYHTVSSEYSGSGGFNTVRSPIGELLYLIKYKGEYSNIQPLADIAASFIKDKGLFICIDCIIPVPPSNLDRYLQPVEEIAAFIGKSLNIPVVTDYLLKLKKTPELKDIDSKAFRKHELKGAFKVSDNSMNNKSILLFDDLYRSGETLAEITGTLFSEGGVRNVYVLTLTKTRSKK